MFPFLSGPRTFCELKILEKEQKMPLMTGRNSPGPAHFVQGRIRNFGCAISTQTTVSIIITRINLANKPHLEYFYGHALALRAQYKDCLVRKHKLMQKHAVCIGVSISQMRFSASHLFVVSFSRKLKPHDYQQQYPH
jgi:hypothetical protein